MIWRVEEREWVKMRGACLCGEMRMRVLGVKCEGESDEYSCVCAVKIECAEREVDGAI